jgi:hypothetical protein
MIAFMLRVIFFGMVIVALLIYVNSGHACGSERWEVKVARDHDAKSIEVVPKVASIELLSRVIAPLHPNAQQNTRYLLELHTFSVSGRLTLIKREADQDYHIVIRDAAGRTMIVEAPDPACAAGSRFLPEITAVRTSIDGFFGGPIKRPRKPKNLTVYVTGVAFFDVLHGQTGVVPNGIELHPILGIAFQGRAR